RLVVNTAPLAGPDQFQGFRDQSLTVAFSALLTNDFDPDGDPIFVSAASASSAHGGSITWDAAQLIYTPPADYSGDDTFNYQLKDGGGGAAPGLVTVAVSPNRAPILHPFPDLVADVLVQLVLTATATDPDGTANHLFYSLAPGAPTNSMIDLQTGVFTWTPA